MEETKQHISNIPFPGLVIDRQGKVLSANEHMGEVFLYEGIVGADVFTLTGLKAQDLFAIAGGGTHPVISRNDKEFRVIAFHAADDEDDLVLLFEDITVLEELKDRYNEERPCIAKIQIDNYDELTGTQGGKDVSNLPSQIEKIIRDWAASLNASVGKVRSSKYMLWFAQGNLEKESFRKFDILDEVRKLDSGVDFPASLSIGIGVGGKTMDITDSYADAALDMALGRGGDQAVIKHINKTEYFGGKLQSVEKSNKGKSRIVGHALTVLISQAPRILIMGHRYSDMDSFGAALGIARLCMANDKNPYIVIEKPNESLEALINQAKDRGIYNLIGCERAIEMCEKDTLVIVVDTHNPEIVQCPELLSISEKQVVIDHHRKMEASIENPLLNYMESYASSASELVSEILGYMLPKRKMEKLEAEALLAGIIVDTNYFSSKTGVRTFEAAAWLRRQGADPTEVKRFFQEDPEFARLKAEALSNAVIMQSGIAIASVDETRSDAQLMCAQLADKLLTYKGIKASFACGRNMDRRTVISARSLGEVNVQVIMEKMGGGGHLNNAAAQVDLSVEGAIRKIMEITEEMI